MRPILIYALSLSVLPLEAEAQTLPRRFEIIMGANFASLHGSDALGWDTRKGGLFGAGLILPRDSAFAIDVAVTYSMKGASASDARTGSTAAAKIDYLEIPVLIRYTIPATGNLKPFFSAGGAASLRTECAIEEHGSGTTVRWTCKEFDQQFGRRTFEFQTIDGSAVVGVGLAFKVNGRLMTLATRYTGGLTTTAKNPDSKHRVLSILGTFEWPPNR